MQAPPVFQMAVRHFGVWRLMRALPTAAAAAATAAWVASALVAGEPLVLPALAVSVLCLAGAAWGPAPAPAWIRWDGQVWHLGAAAPTPETPGLAVTRTGALTVAVDAGAWLLLRWVPADGTAARWLPVQRRGHEVHWHLLRCTVHGARPAADPLAAAVL